MDALAAQGADHLLAKAAQADAVAGNAGVALDQPDHVALGRIALHAQQQIRGAEVEEAEGVALHKLAPVHQLAQLGRGGRNADAQNGVPGLGRGHQMADRADAANAGGDAGHLPKAAAFAELLEAAELGDMEAGIRHLTGIIQMNRDLGVAFDTGDGINHDNFGHKFTSGK